MGFDREHFSGIRESKRMRQANGSDEKHFLGIVASKRMRQANYPEGLHELIDKFPHVLRNYTLLVTGGTFDDVFSKGGRKPLETGKKAWEKYVRKEYKGQFKGEVLRFGKDGGLIQLSERVRDPNINTGVVIFLIDPQDVGEIFPEIQELFRMCAVSNIILLITYCSASLWASNEALGAQNEIDAAKPNDTLAVISHNKKKLDMCLFIVKHRDKLAFFKRIITTGTTGNWVEKFLDLFPNVSPKVDKKKSGPVGGDVMISNEILEKKCQHVCFFFDPDTAHPHEADIYALFRTCTFSDVNVNLRITCKAAESWIETI